MTPLFRLSGTSSFGTPPKKRNMRTCAPVQSGKLLRPGRLGIGEVRGAEHGDENLRLADFAGRRIGDPDPLARIVHERLVAGDMVLPHHRRQPSLEPA